MARTTTPKKTATLGTIVIGSDHGGIATKRTIIDALVRAGYLIVDVGGFDPAISDDYPEYAHAVARAVASDKTGKTKGVLICGTGTGMAIAANRHKGIRAALAYDTYSATMARHDNDANVVTLRGRRFSAREAARLALIFLRTPFSRIPRHQRRIRKIDATSTSKT